MDAALLREREAFKKRAIATPSVENRKKRDKESSSSAHQKKKLKSQQNSSAGSSKSKGSSNDAMKSYKTLPGSSQYKFGLLAKIVQHMKQRHLEGNNSPLILDHILDETNQLDVSPKQRHWLSTEALVNNPKITVIPGDVPMFAFKPAYNIKDRRGLLRLLDRHDQRGLGGILLEDIQESLFNADKALKQISDKVIHVTRQTDKKKVLFYNDNTYDFSPDEEFQKLWRSVAVDGIEDNKIEEYLEKQGITSMQDFGIKKLTPAKKRKAPQKKARIFKRHNDHMGDILQDYSDK